MKKPIFVFGTGRSGTTIFARMFSRHPNLAWLSGLCSRYPDKPGMNRMFLRSLDYPVVGRMLRGRTNAGECYPFWEHYCRGFSEPCRDLVDADVTEKWKHQIRRALSKMTTDKKHRLMIKITGWPRTGFLTQVFADAKFIHVVRDGRAVANSLMQVKFWQGWGGPEKWRWGNLSEAQNEEWSRYDKSFAVLAGIQWKILMDAAERAKRYVDDGNLLEVKYEDLLSDPLTVFKRVATFSELPWTTGFERELKQFKLQDANKKWKQDLNERQQRELNEVLAAHLKRHDYL